MRIGSFQFRASASIPDNLRSLERGLALASERGVELLLTQECGLTGYPPVETPGVNDIDRSTVMEAFDHLQAEAIRYGVAIGVGAVIETDASRHNAMRFLFPDGRAPVEYAKRALWGWDVDNYAPGNADGLFEYRGVAFGIRICFEIRFPEYFRELFDAGVDVTLVAFSDTARQENRARRDMIRSHLVTRAVENAFTVVSANGLAEFQTAPSCILSPDGILLAEAPAAREHLLVHDFQRDEGNFGRKGRIEVSRRLRKMSAITGRA